MAWVSVCDSEGLQVGQMRGFRAGGREVALYRLDDGYFATSAICTHERSILTQGRIDRGRAVVCPLHGARFDIRNGRVLSPPAFKPLKTFPVRVADGQVQVDVEPEA